jgi:hypothetical protein
MILAVSLVQLLLPVFNEITAKDLHIPLSNLYFIFGIVGIMFFTGLLAGSYPALFLSSFGPLQVLKGTIKLGSGDAWFRKALVVFQFALSTILPIGTLVVYYQIEYIQSKNLGLNRENVLYLPINEHTRKHFETLRQEVLKTGAIEEIALTDQNPLSIKNRSSDPRWEGKGPNDNTNFYLSESGYDYIKTLGIQLKEGREFSRDLSTDTLHYIINEESARRMGMENPIGQTLYFWSGKGQVIGVMKDFHHHSMHAPIEPLILMLDPKEAAMMLVRTKAGKTKQALATLENVHKTFSPEYPFEYHFLEGDFERLYKSETLISRLSSYFTVLAVFISCLGLFGLVSFAADRRAKEIGVRKVLGASISSILLLLSKDFLKLILLANLIAWPLAYWAVYEWLSAYPYHIDIGPWLFIWPGLLIGCIALLTMCSRILKAARTNPVNALKYE